jgi:pimeloyl-ACP methyl ester carboxylesterase
MTEIAGISYEERRAGETGGHPPLILIHGAGGTRLHWPPEIRRMEGELVYSLDLPGHGQSPGEGENTIGGYSKRICEWMDAIDLERAVLVGHSMGGAISLTTALDEKDRVAGLVLVGTGGRLRVLPMILEMTGDSQKSSEAVDLVNSYAFSPQAPPRLVELARARMAETRPHVLHGDFQACDGFDILNRLNEITIPTQVICGEDDRLTPVKYSNFMAEAIPDARKKTVEGAGHMVMLEKAGDVATIMKRFLENVFG